MSSTGGLNSKDNHDFSPSDEWPWFLDFICSERGLVGLWEFMHRWFAVRPPKLLDLAIKKGIVEDVDALINEIFIHLAEDDCRRLRQYRRVQGVPFGAWLSKVTRFWVISKIPPEDWRRLNEEAEEQFFRNLQARGISTPAWQEAVRTVNECLKTLTLYQRVLVILRAHEWKPREIAKITATDRIEQIGVLDPIDVIDVMTTIIRPKKTPIQIANDTRFAVRKLTACLERKKPGLFERLLSNDPDEGRGGDENN